jgi:glycine oxidase
MAAGRIVVVGSGIAGAFASYFLARAGADVTLIERDQIGTQASGNNPGGLNPLYGAGIPGPLQALALEGFRLHLDHWDEIRQRAQLDFSGRRKKRLNLALDDDDLGHLERMQETYDSTPGFSARWVEPAELRALEPRLRSDIVRGLLAEGDARVEAAAYTRAVARAAQDLGATLVTAAADGVDTRGDRVIGVRADVESIPCDAVVVATGPWCGEVARWLDLALPVEPVKGEMLLVEADGGGVQTDLACRDIAVYQTGTDQVWLGGTEDHVGFDREVSESARASILERVRQVMPVMADAHVQHQTAGLRPVTPDGMPIVGDAGGWSNVWLTLGGGRKGMLFSAATGFAIAELATTGETDLSIAPCSATRFAVDSTSAGP